MKIVIIGGVAGGASAAARARRLSEDAEIIVLERGHHPSFANCGLPYYVGGTIERRDKLLVAPVEMLRRRHQLDVRVRSEVRCIDRDAKTVEVVDLESGRTYIESYDRLILATGAAPTKPPIPGIDDERVLTLRDLDDADRMHQFATSGATRAAIIGGGFIGIEVAENFVRRGIATTLIERTDQILSPWDREMIIPFQQRVIDEGVELQLQRSAAGFASDADGLTIRFDDDSSRQFDFAVLAIGVRPESGLAADAGIECGSRGGVRVDAHMRTSDPNIYAVGDVAEVTDYVTAKPTQVPLAGPANRQGRIAADHIFGRDSTYRGTQGTAIVGAFDRTAAMTGQSEKQLRASDSTFEKVYIHPVHHAGYYPGAEAMTLKLLFDPTDGRILGGQCVGGDGVDKRIDVLAMAIQARLTVFDLEESELCYAPQYGHAKDPINMAGFVASGVVRGDHPITHVDLIKPDDLVLDVRSDAEYETDHIPGATPIPVEELRERIRELPRDRRIVAYCKVGQRGYLATRMLRHEGFDVVNLSGGFTSYSRIG